MIKATYIFQTDNGGYFKMVKGKRRPIFHKGREPTIWEIRRALKKISKCNS